MNSEETKLVDLFNAKERADVAYERCDWQKYKQMLLVQLELLEAKNE